MDRSFAKTLRMAALAGALGMAVPATAADVRIEYGGPAHTESELRDMVLAAISRDILGSAPAGWSHVVFYRADAGGVDLSLQEGDTTLGSLPADSYKVVAVPAGEHRFGAGEAASIQLRIAPGRAYFVSVAGARGRVRMHRTDVLAFDRASRIAGL